MTDINTTDNEAAPTGERDARDIALDHVAEAFETLIAALESAGNVIRSQGAVLSGVYGRLTVAEAMLGGLLRHPWRGAALLLRFAVRDARRAVAAPCARLFASTPAA